MSWQGKKWLTCCDDYCEFLGDVGTKELEAMYITDKVFAEYETKSEYQDARKYLVAGGDMAGIFLDACIVAGIILVLM